MGLITIKQDTIIETNILFNIYYCCKCKQHYFQRCDIDLPPPDMMGRMPGSCRHSANETRLSKERVMEICNFIDKDGFDYEPVNFDALKAGSIPAQFAEGWCDGSGESKTP